MIQLTFIGFHFMKHEWIQIIQKQWVGRLASTIYLYWLRNSKNCVRPLRLYWRDFKIIFHILLTFYFEQGDRLGGIALLRLTHCMLSLEILSF